MGQLPDIPAPERAVVRTFKHEEQVSGFPCYRDPKQLPVTLAQTPLDRDAGKYLEGPQEIGISNTK